MVAEDFLWPDLPPVPQARACREWLHRVDRQLARGFKAEVDIEHLVRQRAAAADQLVLSAWEHFVGVEDGVALVAVGGYGRGELHPYSDIDVLILLARAEGESLSARLSGFVTFLWDLKLALGHSVRTLKQCLAAARKDVVVATNLMEMRLLAGAEDLFRRLEADLKPERMWAGRKYFEAKRAEQLARHQRYGGTAYNLEPNLKEGPGGLRDIQMVTWVANRHYRARSLHDLVKVGFLEEREYEALVEGQRYLWRLRFGLHLAAGRAEDRLLFDHQRALAREFGFRDSRPDNLAVEQFMQDYFRRVMHLERLNERLLQAFDEDILASDRPARLVIVEPGLQVRNAYLEFAAEDTLDERPELIIKLFAVLQANPKLKGVRAGATRQIRRHLDRMDDRFLHDPEVRRIFAGLWRDGRRLPEILERMHRYEVLDRYLPVFGRIVGRMQFDLFHVYTVDQHTLEVMKYVERFAVGASEQDYPMAGSVFARLEKPVLLYLAAFFHDIAKGRGGDHSELGEAEARRFCADHGFSTGETRLVAWLVRHHLLMSITAQRRDIGDPVVVNHFAQQVGDPGYLDYLYLLTMADISGTSPKLWNTWKARLLADLYLLTHAALGRGLENPVQRSERIAATREEAQAALAAAGVDPAAVEALWRPWPEDYFLRHSADQVTWQAKTLLEGNPTAGPLVAVRRAARGGAAELLVHARNRDGTFATIVDEIGRAGLNIVAARAINTLDAMVIDTFQVLDAGGSADLEEASARSICRRLERALSRKTLTLPQRQPRVPLRLTHFQRPPSITLRPDPGGHGTELELLCSDRPGLLAEVAAVLLVHKVRVRGARIATFGDRVEDFILISDRRDRPLSSARCERLKRALTVALDPGAGRERDPATNPENEACER